MSVAKFMPIPRSHRTETADWLSGPPYNVDSPICDCPHLHQTVSGSGPGTKAGKHQAGHQYINKKKREKEREILILPQKKKKKKEKLLYSYFTHPLDRRE